MPLSLAYWLLLLLWTISAVYSGWATPPTGRLPFCGGALLLFLLLLVLGLKLRRPAPGRLGIFHGKSRRLRGSPGTRQERHRHRHRRSGDPLPRLWERGPRLQCALLVGRSASTRRPPQVLRGQAGRRPGMRRGAERSGR